MIRLLALFLTYAVPCVLWLLATVWMKLMGAIAGM